MERADGKAAGDERLYTCQRIGQADGERAPTPHQTRRAVRVVTEPLHQMWQLTRTQIANDFSHNSLSHRAAAPHSQIENQSSHWTAGAPQSH
jgi:hypothetical protein